LLRTAGRFHPEQAADFSEIRNEIKQFELSLHIHSYKHFEKQVILFEEMMELFLEPLNEVTSKWHNKEEKCALMFTLIRMFNDYETARLLLLNGFPEQAVMPMRDAIECMMLFRLFGKNPKFALRWTDYFKEYKASTVKTFLDELGVDCPEYAFYGMFSQMVHPNLLSVASKVTEHELGAKGMVRSYHFGGMNRPTWTTPVFNNLLVFLLMTILSVLSPVYSIYMKNPEEWWNKVLLVKDKLAKLGANLTVEEAEQTAEQRKIKEQVHRKLKMWKIKAELENLEYKQIIRDKGYSK